MVCRTIGLSDKWFVGQVEFVGQVGCRTSEATCRTTEVSDKWVVGDVTLTRSQVTIINTKRTVLFQMLTSWLF